MHTFWTELWNSKSDDFARITKIRGQNCWVERWKGEGDKEETAREESRDEALGQIDQPREETWENRKSWLLSLNHWTNNQSISAFQLLFERFIAVWLFLSYSAEMRQSVCLQKSFFHSSLYILLPISVTQNIITFMK